MNKETKGHDSLLIHSKQIRYSRQFDKNIFYDNIQKRKISPRAFFCFSSIFKLYQKSRYHHTFLSLKFENTSTRTMPTGTLEVIIVEGRHLKDRDLVGQNDAYVEIYMDKKYKQRTTTISNSNNPVWNERFTFNIHKGDDTIHFDVYDADLVGRDSIGNGKVKLKHVFDDNRFDEWVKLPAHLGLSSHGEIHVVMNFIVSSIDLDARA